MFQKLFWKLLESSGERDQTIVLVRLFFFSLDYCLYVLASFNVESVLRLLFKGCFYWTIFYGVVNVCSVNGWYTGIMALWKLSVWLYVW